MKVYLITYTPNIASSFRVQGIANLVKRFDSWAVISNNEWLIASNSNSNDLFNYFKQKIISTDKILIIEVSTNWIAYGFSNEVINWLRGQIVKP